MADLIHRFRLCRIKPVLRHRDHVFDHTAKDTAQGFVAATGEPPRGHREAIEALAALGGRLRACVRWRTGGS